MSKTKKCITAIQGHFKRRSRAQGLVEFALALPVLLLLIFGIIEFGRLLQAWLALENGARFGVRYATTGEYNPLTVQMQWTPSKMSVFGITLTLITPRFMLL